MKTYYYASTTLLLSIISSTAAQHYTDMVCVDTPGFIDFDGDDCAWYGLSEIVVDDDPYDDDDGATGLADDYYYYDDNLTPCKAYGFYANWDLGGMTAQESCCVCGGGSLHQQFCTDYVPEGQAKWEDVDGYGCNWYSQHIEGSYVDDLDDLADDYGYYEEGENRCSYYGTEGASPDGYTATTACCACGGGVYGNTCVDLPDFVDGLGRSCDYFNSPPEYINDDAFLQSNCLLEGHLNPNPDMGNLTADVACCSCGGGVHDYIGQPSAKPSAKPSVSPTPKPTSSPVGTPSKGPTGAPVVPATSAPVTTTTSAPVVDIPDPAPVATTSAPVAVPVVTPVDPAPVASPATLAPATLAPVKADPVTDAPVPPVTVSPPVTGTDAPVMATTPTTLAPVTVPVPVPGSDPSEGAPSTSAPVMATVPTTLAPVTDAPTAAPVTDAPTNAPVTDAPTPVPVVSTSNAFTMSFDRMKCSVPLDGDALTILANHTANFLNEGASFEIQDMQVTEVNRDNCDTTSTARQTGYGMVDFQMMMEALIKDYGDAVGVLATHISAKFNDTEAVSEFLMEIRNSEVLASAFEMVVGADVNDVNSTIDTDAPTVAPSAAPVTDAPTNAPVVSEATEAPVASEDKAATDAPVASSSSAFTVTSNLSRVMLAVVACAFASLGL